MTRVSSRELSNGTKSDNIKENEHLNLGRFKEEVDRGCRRDHPFGVGGGSPPYAHPQPAHHIVCMGVQSQ